MNIIEHDEKRSAGRQPLDEADERIEPGTFTLDEAMGRVARGEIREGKTLVALLLERARRSA